MPTPFDRIAILERDVNELRQEVADLRVSRLKSRYLNLKEAASIAHIAYSWMRARREEWGFSKNGTLVRADVFLDALERKQGRRVDIS